MVFKQNPWCSRRWQVERWRSKPCCATVITMTNFPMLNIKEYKSMIPPPLLHLSSVFNVAIIFVQAAEFKLHWNSIIPMTFLNIHFKRQVSSHSDHWAKSLSQLIKKRFLSPHPLRDIFKYKSDFPKSLELPLRFFHLWMQKEGRAMLKDKEGAHLILKTNGSTCSSPKRHSLPRARLPPPSKSRTDSS